MSAVKTLFFVSFFRVDLEPSVAASLVKVRSNEEAIGRALPEQTEAAIALSQQFCREEH